MAAIAIFTLWLALFVLALCAIVLIGSGAFMLLAYMATRFSYVMSAYEFDDNHESGQVH